MSIQMWLCELCGYPIHCITCADPKVRSVNRDQPSGVSDGSTGKNEIQNSGPSGFPFHDRPPGGLLSCCCMHVWTIFRTILSIYLLTHNSVTRLVVRARACTKSGDAGSMPSNWCKCWSRSMSSKNCWFKHQDASCASETWSSCEASSCGPGVTCAGACHRNATTRCVCQQGGARARTWQTSDRICTIPFGQPYGQSNNNDMSYRCQGTSAKAV